jgi:hypothetical protein
LFEVERIILIARMVFSQRASVSVIEVMTKKHFVS